MFCIYCGKEVVDYAIYCNHCGKYIGETTTSKDAYDPELEAQVDEYGPLELLDDFSCNTREIESTNNDNDIVFSYGYFPWQDDN